MGRLFDADKVFHDNSGNVLASGLVTFYTNNTTTLKATYSDKALTVSNPNPITLGADGRSPTDVFGSGSYTIAITDVNGASIEGGDDVVTLEGDDLADYNYHAGWTGYVARTLEDRLQDEIYVNDFGAVGDGSTDSTTGIDAAHAYVQANGGALIFPDKGRYLTSNKIIFSEDRSIEYRGHYSNAVEGGTELSLINSSDSTLLDIRTGIHILFYGLRLSVDTNSCASAVRTVLQRAAGDTPILSSINVTYQGVHFANRGSGSLTESVWVYDSVNTRFSDCWFTTSNIAATGARLGENAGANPSTFGNGNCAGVEFDNCLFAADVAHRRGWNFRYHRCSFQARDDGTPAVISASGDQQDRQVVVDSCAFFGGDNTRTLITQGTAGENLSVVNTRLAGGLTGIVYNGKGGGAVEGCTFSDASMTTGVQVNDPARNVRISPANNFDAIYEASGASIDDNTTSGPKRYWEVDTNLAADDAFTSSGFTGNEICDTTIDLIGGMYHVKFAVEIVSAETTVYEARLVVDGTAQGFPVKKTITSGETDTLTYDRVLNLPTKDGVTIGLQTKQTANSSASTMKQDSSFLQVHHAGYAG